MKLKKNEKTSVQVIPKEGSYEAAVALFRSLAFEPAVCGVGSFSIETTVGQLERLFGVHLRPREDGLIECVYKDGSVGWEFPLERLGPEAQVLLEAVSFSPIDFGPVDFMR
jgi:hypothetical protein